MDGLKCVICDGVDFFIDAGFYFCSECQTQAAGVQEQEFEQLVDVTVVVPKTKKTKSCSSSKTPKAEQITSWECYNYILLGLVNELVELGASEQIKPIVQTIWFTYLKKIEVVHNNVNKPPNLPAYNHKHDAKIIFGRCGKKKVYKRKRAASCSSAGSVSDSESTVSTREQNRLKRLMAKAMYESQQTQSTVQSESSLINQSLGSLKSTSSMLQKDNFLNFSKTATDELRTHMSGSHLKEHIEDVDVALNCHNLSYRDISCGYKRGPNMMTQTKLYAILYLALLINKDDIHLGDLLRFMNEGSLSYNYYQHFFPEDVDAQTSFLNAFKVNKVYKHDTYRAEAGKMAAFLDLNDDLPTPNIVNLIIRYCKELNLPTEICNACLNFIAHAQPEMKVVNNTIPNYEAKAMCVIVFVLKLLFGLDDVTELHLSSFADHINEGQQNGGDRGESTSTNMFSFMDWLKSTLCRRHVLAKHHFPTGFNEKNYSTEDFIDFMKAYYFKYDIQRQEDFDYENIDRVLGNSSDCDRKTLQFNPSFTPLCDNMKVLVNSNVLNHYELKVLLKNYEDASIQHLRRPNKYFTNETEVMDRGANGNIKMEPIFHTQKPYVYGKNKITCRLTDGSQCVPKVNDVDDDEIDTQNIVNLFSHVHAENVRFWKDRSFNEFGLAANVYTKHYRPDRRYWLRLGANILNMRIDEFDKFWGNFPYHFRLLVGECAAITCQGAKDLLVEFNYFDSYVCFKNLFNDECVTKKGKFRRNNHLDNTLRRLVKAANDHW